MARRALVVHTSAGKSSTKAFTPSKIAELQRQLKIRNHRAGYSAGRHSLESRQTAHERGCQEEDRGGAEEEVGGVQEEAEGGLSRTQAGGRGHRRFVQHIWPVQPTRCTRLSKCFEPML
jgi:hypothetical protein